MRGPLLLGLLSLPLVALAHGPPGAPSVLHLGGGEFVIDVPVDHLSADEHDRLLEQASGDAPSDTAVLKLWAETSSGARVPAESLVPRLPPPPEKEGEKLNRSFPTDAPGAQDGFLSERAVYLSQCHGYIWYDTLSDYSTQRGNHFDTVEDLHNPEALNQFLAPYLENAGAAVFTVKERDHNPRMAIADNGGADYAEVGSGFVDGPAGFGPRDTWSTGTNPFTSGTTRRFPADGGGRAVWTPDVPEDGYYGVYVSWKSDASHARQAHYQITHDGGVIDRWFDQTVHGSTWQYVETLWLRKGKASLEIALIGDTGESGRFLSADAVRVGGGTGDVLRNSKLTGRPRWEEGAQLYTQFNGAPTSVYNAGDVSARSRWAAWEHPAGEDALYLSWHSNACGTGDTCTARGTVTYIYAGAAGDCTGGEPVTGSRDLAQRVNDELVGAFRALWEPGWQQRGTNGVASACFGEVNPASNNEMPSALVELAFHNNATDASYLKNPEFRRDAARAMYRGIVRYFATRDGLTPKYLPEPPTHLAITHDDAGRLRVSWEPGLTGAPFGDPATSYLVQTSADGRAWDNGVSVTGTSTVLDTAAGRAVYVRVIGVNDGGVSFPSEAMGARRSPDGTVPVLVVSAFDRFDTGLLPWETLPRVSAVRRMYVPRVNPGDTAAVTGRAIEAAGWYFDAVSDEVFDGLDLTPYRLVVWVAGEESTADETFSTAQQQKLAAFLGAGGTLWASGAEILWDLDERGDAADRAFAADVLGATMASDDAGTSIVAGEGVLAGVGPLDFGETLSTGYPVEFPDALTSTRPVVARYDGGAIAGVLGEGVALFGFPFETIRDPEARAAAALAVMSALVPDYVPPEPGDTDEPGAGNDWDRHEISAARCGCATSGTSGATWLIAAGALVLITRRRLSLSA